MTNNSVRNAANAVMKMVAPFSNQFHVSRIDVLRQLIALAEAEANRLNALDLNRNR